MKRLLIILAGILLAVSCNETGEGQGPGTDNPLSECVIPASVQAGEEALVQWNGFTQDSRILLVSEDGREYEMPVKVFTASGVMFVVPADVPAGIYKLVVERGGRLELGTMEVLAAAMPVIGLKIPSGALEGEEVIIEGVGFEDGCSIVFADADGKECVLRAALVSSGVSVLLPDDLGPGDYVVYLLQNGVRWMISPSFSIYPDSSPKLLRRIDYYSPYVGTAMIRLSWEIDYDEPVSLTLSEYLVEDGEETLQAYDRYDCGADGYFELTVDGFESSNDLEISYVRDADGRVTRSDVLIYGNKEPTAFTWTYDADGYLADISSPSRSFRSLTHTDGNLTSFRSVGFGYGNSDLVNHPSAPDVAWAYMAMMEPNDPFVYFPYLLGWYTEASLHLPVTMTLPDPSGSGTLRHSLTYEFDQEGYVVKMMWESSSIDFIYE